jgi:hypothetical protein
MNFALILLWLVVIGVTVLLVYLSLKTQSYWFENKSVPIGPPTGGKCIIPTNSVPDVSNDRYCVGPLSQGLRFDPGIKLGSNVIIGGVIGTAPIYYGTVCSEFCSAGLDPSKIGQCIGGTGQDNYNACVSTLKPVGCTDPALPIGYDNKLGSFYYLIHTNNTTCQITVPPP